MAYTTVPKSTAYFDTKLYSGNGGTQTITGVSFQPDWTWIKNRDAGEHHVLTDAVRGANKQLRTNGVNAQGTLTTQLTGFTSDGFSVGAGSEVNNGSQTYASWNWKANGQGSSNTAGTINSTYTSANTTSGFSIVQYTGNASQAQTVGHGLGVAPKLIIFKSLTTTDDWSVCCPSVLGVDGRLTLNSSAANSVGDNTFWNSAAPSSTLFSLGNNSRANASGKTIIAYCFAEVKGFSKFSSYIGNGNANGTFVYTGFKPALVITKNYADSGGASNNGGNWRMFDTKRLGYNVNNATLYPNLGNAEANETSLDLLSNGFKFRGTSADYNQNGSKYVYMAFAEEPLVSTNGQPATAR
jgi:hypothetical protein